MLAYRHYFFNSLLGHYALYQLVVIVADRLADKNVFDDGKFKYCSISFGWNEFHYLNCRICTDTNS